MNLGLVVAMLLVVTVLICVLTVVKSKSCANCYYCTEFRTKDGVFVDFRVCTLASIELPIWNTEACSVWKRDTHGIDDRRSIVVDYKPIGSDKLVRKINV